LTREVKVGLLVISAFIILGIGVFLVSERRNLFALKNTYFIELETVSGLAQGSPVHLDGVGVGSIQRIVLPQQVEKTLLTVWVTADRRYAERIREDSLATIKTLGLLGDKYVDISSGTTLAAVIPAGGEIPAAPPTDVDRLIATGGDVMGNVVSISYSLRHILERMEAGEGILGELTTDSEEGTRAKNALLEVIESTRRIIRQIDEGDGTLARLINDDSLVVDLEGSIGELGGLLTDVRHGSGALPALLNDPQTREQLEQLVTNFQRTSRRLAEITSAIAEGEGLLSRMLNDEEYAQRLTVELEQLLENLRVVSDRIAGSQGTLGLLISDPAVYEAMNDIIVGVDESKMLRWLVRNRQKKGIEKRYEAEQLESQPGPADRDAVDEEADSR
jgi:phospholipid/cholesterol/gamma-HCH transport system substrate-binding protein